MHPIKVTSFLKGLLAGIVICFFISFFTFPIMTNNLCKHTELQDKTDDFVRLQDQEEEIENLNMEFKEAQEICGRTQHECLELRLQTEQTELECSHMKQMCLGNIPPQTSE